MEIVWKEKSSIGGFSSAQPLNLSKQWTTVIKSCYILHFNSKEG